MIRNRVKTGIFFILLLSFFLNQAHSLTVKRILINGKIFTGVGSDLKEAVVIIGKRIAYIGTNRIAIKYRSGNGVEVFDLKGKTIIPGFHDGDTNFGLGARLLRSNINFRGLAIENILHKLKIEKKEKNKGEVINGYIFEHLIYKRGKWPNKYDLDKVSTENPIVVFSSEGNYGWVNSLVMKNCGITNKTPDVPGGVIERFRDGEPTGIFRDNALKLLKKYNFKKSFKKEKLTNKEILAAIKYANSFGITSITSRGDLSLVSILKELESKGKLTLRFNIILPSGNIGNYLIKKIKFDSVSPYVKIRFLGSVLDGDFFTADAAMFTHYKESNNYGYMSMNEHELKEIVELYYKNGIMGSFHAEGDRAVHIVLNAIARLSRRFSKNSVRHRIENFKFITDEDINRLRSLSIVPVIRPVSFVRKTGLIEHLVGERRAVNALRTGTLKNKNLIVAIGSGWPGNPLDPRLGLYFSVFRTGPGSSNPATGWFLEEKISLKDALGFYTFGSSFAAFSDTDTGTIEKGKFADLTILDGDIFSNDFKAEVDLFTIHVVETIVSGKTVYRKDKSIDLKK